MQINPQLQCLAFTGVGERIVVNLRSLNAQVDEFKIPTATSRDVLRDAVGGSINAQFDITSAFLHVPIEPSSRRYFQVYCPGLGTYRFCRAPFGFRHSGDSFSLALTSVLRTPEVSSLVDDLAFCVRRPADPLAPLSWVDVAIAAKELGSTDQDLIKRLSACVAQVRSIVDDPAGQMEADERHALCVMSRVLVRLRLAGLCLKPGKIAVGRAARTLCGRWVLPGGDTSAHEAGWTLTAENTEKIVNLLSLVGRASLTWSQLKAVIGSLEFTLRPFSAHFAEAMEPLRLMEKHARQLAGGCGRKRATRRTQVPITEAARSTIRAAAAFARTIRAHQLDALQVAPFRRADSTLVRPQHRLVVDGSRTAVCGALLQRMIPVADS